MTMTIGAVTVSLTPVEELTALVDRNAFLEQQITRTMSENDDQRSCISALRSTVDELQQTIAEIDAHAGER